MSLGEPMIVLSNSILDSKAVERTTIQANEDPVIDTDGPYLPLVARFLLRLHLSRHRPLAPDTAATARNVQGDGF